MSMVEQILYKALKGVKEECSKHESCHECPLDGACTIEMLPAAWDEKQMDKMAAVMGDIGWKRK